MGSCLDRLVSYFKENSVSCVVQYHRKTFTARERAVEVHDKPRSVAKVFMAWSDGELIMFVLPADSHIDLKRARHLLASQDVRQAREAEFADVFSDCEVGAMPPFGNLYGLPVYLDTALARNPYLVCAAGCHHLSIKLATADYLQLVGPTVAAFTVQAQASHELVAVPA